MFAGVLGTFVTKLVRDFSLKFGWGDKPNQRKIHTKIIPTMGGIGIFIGFCAVVPISIFLDLDLEKVLPLVIVGFFLVVIGIWDDFNPMGFSFKFFLQLISGGFLIYSGFRVEKILIPFYHFDSFYQLDLGFFSIPFTLFWLIGVTNAVNLIDGLDGLAGGVAGICSFTFGVIALLYDQIEIAVLSFGLTGGILGFLRYNFHPASIFMGDTGSLLLGFVLGGIGIKIGQLEQKDLTMDLLPVVVILTVPIFDTLIAIFRRLSKKMHPFKPDKEHIHHRLVELGLNQKQAVILVYIFTLLFCALGFWVKVDSGFLGINLLIIFALLTALAIKRLGYIEFLRYTPPRFSIDIRTQQESYLPPINLNRIGEKCLILISDFIAINFAFLLTYLLKFEFGLFTFREKIPIEFYVVPIIWFSAFWIILFVFSGLYEMPWEIPFAKKIITILKTVLIGILILFLLLTDGFNDVFGEMNLILLIYGALIYSGFVLGRGFVIWIEKRFRILEYSDKIAVIVGAGERGKQLLEQIRKYPKMNYKIVGFLVEDKTKFGNSFQGINVLGEFDELEKLATEHKIQEALVAISATNYHKMLELLYCCIGLKITFKVMPDLYDITAGYKTTEVRGVPLVRIATRNISFWGNFVKRTLDLFISFFLTILLLPFGICIWSLVKLTSKGTGFIKQDRVGKNGYIFKIYKFRSMVQNAEEDTGPILAVIDDKRITPFGSFLRKYKLDELPQLINVLKGEMSLVGPRPERPYFVEQLQKNIPFYTKRLVVRPGITGWAQVKGKKEQNLFDTKEKMKYDLFYLENMGIWFDFKILFKTISIILFSKSE